MDNYEQMKKEVDSLMDKNPKMAKLLRTSIQLGFLEGIKRANLVVMDHYTNKHNGSVEVKAACAVIAVHISKLGEDI